MYIGLDLSLPGVAMRQGSGAAPATFTVLSSDGTTYTTARDVLASDGTSYTVPATVLSSDGTSYTVS
jgi:hypothetical protein